MTIRSITQDQPGNSPKIPLWKKVLSGLGRILSRFIQLMIIGSIVFGAGWLLVDWWNEASEPKSFACQQMAEDTINSGPYLSNIDVHLMETQGWNKARAVVLGNDDNGWWISAAIV